MRGPESFFEGSPERNAILRSEHPFGPYNIKRNYHIDRRIWIRNKIHSKSNIVLGPRGLTENRSHECSHPNWRSGLFNPDGWPPRAWYDIYFQHRETFVDSLDLAIAKRSKLHTGTRWLRSQASNASFLLIRFLFLEPPAKSVV